MNILDKIVAYKKEEVAQRKQEIDINMLEKTGFFDKPILSLKEFLLDPSKTGIIAEFKRQSPSKGVINGDADVMAVTAAYTKYGASGLSVLTDAPSFGYRNPDFSIARQNQVPLLRKDFIIDEYQLIESRSMGADVILLIAACLTPAEVKKLAAVAHSLQLEVLLELHAEEELEYICDEVDLVGINNRNLKTFAVDIERSLEMASRIPAGKLKVAESGISSVDNIRIFKENGFHGFLIGEHFMKTSDPGAAFKAFVAQLETV
jgi:indole-3-glycerol phosphate synthase